MEAVVILGILGANYLFNNDNKYDKTPPNDFSDSSMDDVSVDIPNNTDIYNLNNYADSEKIIKSTANDMIKKINNNKYLQTLKSIDNNKDRLHNNYTVEKINDPLTDNPSNYDNLSE